MLKTVLIIVVSVSIFGIVFFIIIKNLLKKKLSDYVNESNNEDKY
tara:strand:+ start:367 stop:501 length:135 start_codon:yes stop_codon:yes gene_type:complete